MKSFEVGRRGSKLAEYFSERRVGNRAPQGGGGPAGGLWLERLTRFGYTVKGAVYVVVGVGTGVIGFRPFGLRLANT